MNAILKTASLALFAITVAAAHPARADDDDWHRHDRGHHWGEYGRWEHHHREYGYGHPAVVYAPPGVVYAQPGYVYPPPVVVYAPPPPPPTATFVFPLNFR
jgi:hypothetical protein